MNVARLSQEVAVRRLTGEGPALELVEAFPDSQATGAPLLFVHGAFSGAWCWAERFLPFFARVGDTRRP